MVYILLPASVAPNLDSSASHKSLATRICRYASTNLSPITLRTHPTKTTVASVNAFSWLGVIVPVGVALASQNTFIAVSHKVVLVCQRLKYVPVNGAGFSAAAKP